MMEAFAAETAGAVAHAEPFYAEPEFWVALAFVILMVLVAKPVAAKIGAALDQRSDSIRKQIEEARRLRDEAQELLAAFQRKQRDAEKEAAAIVEQSKREAERLAERAAADLEHSLKRREQQALDRIAQAESKALDEVRALAVDVALAATQRLLADRVKGAKADALIDDAVKGLADKLN
jgi:F-type H+-transporting ATPase subunit b